jgi:hypothetical protein
MIVLLLIFIIQCVFGNLNFLSNETLRELNEMKYYHESIVIGEEAEFIFTIFNTNYTRNILDIDSYYFATTFIEEERHEVRSDIVPIPTNETKYHGKLIMEGLEEKGNYLVCVFFLTNKTELIASSRFCHVVSVSGNCDLEPAEKQFTDLHIFVILGFASVLLTATVLFTCIRAYIYRPRTTEALLRTFPGHHVQRLEVLAHMADNRRRRRTQQALSNHLRTESVYSIDYDPIVDHVYTNYHRYDNASLDTVPE